MAMNTFNKNKKNNFLKQNGNLIAELEFRDSQAGFVGIAGIIWTILPDGTSRANRFVNNTVSSSFKTCRLEKQDLASIANALSKGNFTELPNEIPSEQTINPHRVTIRLGEQSSTLQLQAGESISNALKMQQNQQETPRRRFLIIAWEINQIIRKHCGNY